MYEPNDELDPSKDDCETLTVFERLELFVVIFLISLSATRVIQLALGYQ